MKTRYKVVISNRNLYKEVELSPEMTHLTIGTTVDAEVRLRKELFFGVILLDFTRSKDGWNLVCSDNLYFNMGDVRKLVSLSLEHGMEWEVCYQNSDNTALSLQFLIDFDYETKDYNRKIDFQGIPEIKIGGAPDSNIQITDEDLGKDAVFLQRQNDTLYLIDPGCRYGVYVNGARISKRQEIREHDFFSLVGCSFYYKENCLYTSEKTTIRLSGLSQSFLESHATVFRYPKFHRNTRVQHQIPEEPVEVQQPSAKPTLQNRSILLTILPMLVMIAMTILLRGVMGGGGTFVIYSAVSMGMGVIVSVITYIQDTKTFREETKKREESYLQYIDEKEQRIQEMRTEELRIRRLIYESIENGLSEVDQFGRRLFERTIQDPDYLQIYLGTGKIEASCAVTFSKQEFIDTEDPISLLPAQLAETYRYIDDAPIISDFNASCGVGIVGRIDALRQMLKNITLDLAIRHFYKEVRLVYLLDENYVESFEWLKWLRNVENETLDIRNIACDEESQNVVLEYLYTVLSGRENFLREEKNYLFQEQYVVFVTDSMSIVSHPVSRYIEQSRRFGFTFVFLEEYEENLPQGCNEILRLGEQRQGHALRTVNGEAVAEFTYPAISDRMAQQTALKLGAVYVDEISLEAQLTKNITIFELLGIISADDLDLSKRWESSQVYRTIAAPIGVRSGGEIVSLDISDKGAGHGPHGLVAGTTGSGKSELLQTYILSIATLFHPYDVGFVLIDFKGGGMANQFEHLPHLIGTITNIDGREINRSLLSIKAELVKRQEMFSEAGVNHINDYIRLFKAGAVETPIPHLVIIVDEFAELKAEHPDFMKELISAARIGRTLGVHLILATQKPAGVVDAQIWSNSKFRFCLKVQTKDDSNEVIKSPLAAEIVEPGRAYFQVGNNEVFELIQSAYSGANVPAGNDLSERIYSIYERNLWGKKTLVYTNQKKEESSNQESQLQAIVDYVELYCQANNIERLPGICLPPLETVVRTDQLDYGTSSEFASFSVPVGFYDDPEQQRQGVVTLELAKENVYIVGSAQTGKTVLLQTITYGLIRSYTPRQVHLYMIDCGSMVLKIFEDSAHVGGVVLSNEEEKCKNLFKLLNTVIGERKQILSGKGVGNFASYLEAGYTDMPLVVVMIDNMAAFKEYFPNQAEQLNSLAREAQGVGLSFIVTASASNALSYRTQASFGRKIVYHCNDSSEYSNVFGHCKETPAENPGRALFLLDKRILEWQTAIFGASKKEAERSQEFRAFINTVNMTCDARAIQIPMVPERLVLADEMKANPKRFQDAGIIPIGMDFSTVDFSCLDIERTGSLTLLGDSDAKTRFVKGMFYILAKNIVFHNVEAIVLDDRQKNLEEVGSYGFVRDYTSDAAEGLALLQQFYSELNVRSEMEDTSEISTILLVMQNPDLFRQICADKSMSRELAAALKQANETKGFLLLTPVENAVIGFSSSEALKTARDERRGILFAPAEENKFFEVSGRIRGDRSFDQTMGYRFEGGDYSRIKLFE